MSKQNQRSNKKPNCLHCRNLGLKNDHWLRANCDPNSELLCPVLLNTECKYCHQVGHNVSKCARLAASKKRANDSACSAAATATSDDVKTIHVDVKMEGPKKMSYAQMASQLMQVLHENPNEVASSLGIRVIENPNPTKKFVSVLRYTKKHTSWADTESDEEEEEEE